MSDLESSGASGRDTPRRASLGLPRAEAASPSGLGAAARDNEQPGQRARAASVDMGAFLQMQATGDGPNEETPLWHKGGKDRRRASGPRPLLSRMVRQLQLQLAAGGKGSTSPSDKAGRMTSLFFVRRGRLLWWTVALLAIVYLVHVSLVFRRALVANADADMGGEPAVAQAEPAEPDGARLVTQMVYEHHEVIEDADRLQSEILSTVGTNDLRISQLCRSKRQYAADPKRFSSLSRGVYYVAVNLYQSEAILADFLFQLTSLLQALRTQRVFVCIYENASSDHTKLGLQLFHAFLASAHIPHHIQSSPEGRPPSVHRIDYLAQVRNQAMQPLYSNFRNVSARAGMSFTSRDVTRVLFLNDALFCAEDTLELLLQAERQDADITCGVDFDIPENPGFYDTWVARDIAGHALRKRPLMDHIEEPTTGARMREWLPTQVQCCWNGIVALSPRPFVRHNVRFRRSSGSECSASECSLLCNDFGRHGYDRALIVPRTLVAYEEATFRRLLDTRDMQAPLKRSLADYDADARVPRWAPLPRTVDCQGLVANNTRSPDQALVAEAHDWGRSRHLR